MNYSEIISDIVDRLGLAPTVDPVVVATEAMVRIGFHRSLHVDGYQLAHMQLRQLARQFLRRKFDRDNSDADDPQGMLFDGMLQQRYPRAPVQSDEAPVYILLDLMNDDDIAYNVARLRKEANAKMEHADALEAYGVERSSCAA